MTSSSTSYAVAVFFPIVIAAYSTIGDFFVSGAGRVGLPYSLLLFAPFCIPSIIALIRRQSSSPKMRAFVPNQIREMRSAYLTTVKWIINTGHAFLALGLISAIFALFSYMWIGVEPIFRAFAFFLYLLGIIGMELGIAVSSKEKA